MQILNDSTDYGGGELSTRHRDSCPSVVTAHSTVAGDVGPIQSRVGDVGLSFM